MMKTGLKIIERLNFNLPKIDPKRIDVLINSTLKKANILPLEKAIAKLIRQLLEVPDPKVIYR